MYNCNNYAASNQSRMVWHEFIIDIRLKYDTLLSTCKETIQKFHKVANILDEIVVQASIFLKTG